MLEEANDTAAQAKTQITVAQQEKAIAQRRLESLEASWTRIFRGKTLSDRRDDVNRIAKDVAHLRRFFSQKESDSRQLLESMERIKKDLLGSKCSVATFRDGIPIEW